MWLASVMMPTWLPVQRRRLDPELGQRHAEQCHGDALPGAHEHVVLPGRLDAAHRVRQMDQLVRRLAHGAHDGDHVGPLAAGPGDVVGHGSDAVRVTDRGATEFLDDQGHRPGGYRLGRHRPVSRATLAPLAGDPGAVVGAVPTSGRSPAPPQAGGDPRGHLGLDMVAGRAQREESPPARGPTGPTRGRGQASQAAQADPQRDHRCRDHRRHRRPGLPAHRQQQQEQSGRQVQVLHHDHLHHDGGEHAKLQAQADAAAVRRGAPPAPRRGSTTCPSRLLPPWPSTPRRPTRPPSRRRPAHSSSHSTPRPPRRR